jgi:O-antigen biosynthesis protein
LEIKIYETFQQTINTLIDLSIIIVNYNVKILLENCINSIFSAIKKLNVEIIIVDNNSYDGSIAYIKTRFQDVACIKIVESKINLGFGKANNIAAKEAKGKYLLILNPDTVLQEDTLEKTLNFYNSVPNIGVVTCKLVLPNGKLDLACRRGFPDTVVAVYRMLGLSKLFPKSKLFGRYNLTYLDENQTYEVDSICGAFMLVRKDIFDKVHGFDEDYFMYGEDIDLCFRIKKAGFKIFYYSETRAIHFKGESTRKSSLSYVNNFYGAMGIFVKKNLHDKFALMNLIIRLSIFSRASLSYILRFIKFSYPIVLDLVMVISAMLISIKLRFESFPLPAYQLVIIVYSIIWMLSLALNGTYKKNNVLSFTKPLYGILIGFFINSSFTYFFNEYAFSRVVVIRATAYSFLLMIIWRIINRMVIIFKQKNIFYNAGNTLIIGRNEESEKFLNKLKIRVDSEYDIIGYIAVNENNADGYIGNLNNMNDIISAEKIKNIIFAKNELSNQQLLDIMWGYRNSNIMFKLLSSDNEILLGKSALDKIDDIYLMQIEYNINKKFNILVKRVFDIFFGLLCILLVYPTVFIYIKLFNIESEKLKFLNKVLLIPDVIRGKLSFVGRAIWDKSSIDNHYLGKSGLTGLVQINYYKNLTSYEIEYFNFYYAKNQSLALDLEIVLKTITLFIFRRKIFQL